MLQFSKYLIHKKKNSISSLDSYMLSKEGLLKVLHWALSEGRIYLLNQLAEPSYGFLWSLQKLSLIHI